MLETPWIRRYCLSHLVLESVKMDSDNPTGADNQQERPGIEQWVVGFVDVMITIVIRSCASP
jgi:hypothetical protein